MFGLFTTVCVRGCFHRRQVLQIQAFLAHLTLWVRWAIVTTKHPSFVRPLTFHILINSSEATGPIWTKLWWDGPLPKLCPVIPTSNQDGHQAKDRKKRGGWNFNCSYMARRSWLKCEKLTDGRSVVTIKLIQS